MVDVRDVASKAADNVVRMAANFHLFENGSVTGLISADHVISAAKIVSWHLYEARRFLTEISAPLKNNDVIILDKWLLKKEKKEISITDILQFGPNRLRKRDALNMVLNELKALNRLKVQGSNVVINPELLKGGLDGIA
jgi:putative DNA primase/helicase